MYFDPGFGSMLIQLLVAGIAVAGAVFLSVKGKLKGLFTKNKKPSIDENSVEPVTNEDSATGLAGDETIEN